MADVPENAPEHCPGTASEEAGKASSCAGCPNQEICASGQARAPDPDLPRIQERLACVKHRVLVLSGKGGVGKSTVSAMLSRALALDADRRVALLDVDICGPSVPRIMGLEGENVHHSGSGWSPVFVKDNLAVMSVGFLLASPDDAVIWRGPKKNGLIKQFLRDVDWGETDYLVVDTPPGTSDEHLSLVQYLQTSGIDGALIVTTPQEVALLDVRKEITFCRKVGVRVLGVIENMAAFTCPKCETTTRIFPPSTGGAAQMCADMQVPFLGSIPLDPRVARSCDEGLDLTEEPTATTRCYVSLANRIMDACEASGKEGRMDTD